MAEDELEPLITECPNCRTRFRVTENQLQVASGRVRCGACLTVFQGIDHLVWENAPEFASADEAKDALDALLDELDETASDDTTDRSAELADLKALGRDPIGSAPVALPPDAPELDDWPQDDRQLYVGHEEEPAEDLDEVDEETPESAGAEITLEAAPEPAEIPVFASAAEEPAEPPLSAAAEADADADTGAGVAADADAEIEDSAPPAPDPAEGWEADEETAALLAGAAPPEDELELADDAVAAEEESTAAESPADEPLPAELLDDLRAQPTDVSFAPEPRRWWIGAVTLLGVLLLVAQIFFYQFDRWGKDPALRPIYAFACDLVGCDLPVLRDLAALRTDRLMVRSHPDFQDALVVDAVIVNEASFAQPFPVLDLRFTTLQGEISAQRRFQPAEYLAGELEGATMMAPRTPVRLELAIDDPGGEAVNYFLDFR